MRRRRPLRAEDALARAVLEQTLRVRRGESVAIEAWSHSLPWARALVVEARRRGARPTLIVEDESAFFRSLELLGGATWSGPVDGKAEGADARIYLDGPEAFPRLLGLPAADLDAWQTRRERPAARSPRSRPARTVRLAIADATATAAARYGVDPIGWQNELLRASLVDPRSLEAQGRRFTRAVAGAHRVRVRHSNGTDLSFELSARPPILDVGRPRATAPHRAARLPSGILLLAVREGSAEGTWEANRPSYDRFAVPPVAVGGRFEFRRGRLDEFAFDRGGGPFAAAYARAGRARERPAAMSLGLNPSISGAPEA
ncbi:MAG: hypothetical protein ACREDE_06030, partial [Thermoplasmata archaeon]